jgi:hypothetical protein
MKRFLIGTLLVASSVIGLAPTAAAENWASVVTSDFDGRVYQIDLEGRQEYISKTGWRHVSFKISSDQDRHWHAAMAACNPFQLYVPDYKWDWEIGYTSDSAYTVAGALARAACNW